MNGRLRYLCGGCRTETKLLDRDAPESVQTGCGLCERITTHVAQASVAHHLLPTRGARA